MEHLQVGVVRPRPALHVAPLWRKRNPPVLRRPQIH